MKANGFQKLERFRYVVLGDFEFWQPPDSVNSVTYVDKHGETRTDTGNVPVPVAFTGLELWSGKKISLGYKELQRCKEPPYPLGPDALFVSYFGTAELGCHLALKWPMPANVLDLYPEFRRAQNYPRIHPPKHFYEYDVTRLYKPPDPFPYPPKYVPELDDFDEDEGQTFGLLAAREAYRLPALMTSEHKTAMRNRIMAGPPYQQDEMRTILAYCMADTCSLVDLLEAMLPDIDIDLALLRGDYLKAVAHQEYQGIPIDPEVFPKLLHHLPEIQRRLIEDVNRPYGFYVDGKFSNQRFVAYALAHGIPWRLTATGKPMLKDDYLKEQCDLYTTLEDFRQLRKTISKAQKITIPVGKDFRHRTLLSPFGTVTGRNAPGRFLFGQAKWMRFLAKADPGWLLPNIDWSQQELGIGAVLSGDLARQAAYCGEGVGASRRDFYLILAAIMHCNRDQAKVFTLAEQYAAGIATLARLMRRPAFVVKRLLRTLHARFPAFYDWVGRIVNAAYRDGKLETALGWQVLTPKHGANTRTLRNFLVQGYGADLLRLSVARAVEAGINVIGTMHDSILIHAPREEAYAQRRAMQDIMAAASRELLDGFELATSTERVIRRRYYDDKGLVMWKKVQNILADCR